MHDFEQYDEEKVSAVQDAMDEVCNIIICLVLVDYFNYNSEREGERVFVTHVINYSRGYFGSVDCNSRCQ